MDEEILAILTEQTGQSFENNLDYNLKEHFSNNDWLQLLLTLNRRLPITPDLAKFSPQKWSTPRKIITALEKQAK